MDCGGEHPQRHLANYAELLQADTYGGYGQLYAADRVPGPILEAACCVHARRPFFVLADQGSRTPQGVGGMRQR